MGPEQSQHLRTEEIGLLQLVSHCLSQLSHMDVQQHRMSEASKKYQLMRLPSYLQQGVRCDALVTGTDLGSSAVWSEVT